MDITRRQITKISREVSKFTVHMLKIDGIGMAEYDFIYVIRKNPGITQAEIREILSIDKGATARRTANLEAKGYLIRKPNSNDNRSQLMFATEKSEMLKNSKVSVEALYYEWLTEEFSDMDKANIVRLLNLLYEKTKAESKAGFPNATERFIQQKGAAREA